MLINILLIVQFYLQTQLQLLMRFNSAHDHFYLMNLTVLLRQDNIPYYLLAVYGNGLYTLANFVGIFYFNKIMISPKFSFHRKSIPC